MEEAKEVRKRIERLCPPDGLGLASWPVDPEASELMLRFAVDENFNNHILHGMLRRKPNLDAVRVQDVGLLGGRRRRDP